VSAKRAKKRGQLTPLGEQRYLVRRGEAPIARVLAPVLGERLLAQLMESAVRAELDEIASDVRVRAPETGVIYAPPRTARASFRAAPVRSEESAPVRRMALLVLDVLEHFEPGGQRVASRALWLGHPNPPYRQCPNSISGRTGVGVRELQRYLVILEAAGVIKRWQPRSGSKSLKSKSGRCYNVYELQAPVMPAELHTLLSEWRATHVRAAAKLQRQAAAAPLAPVRAPTLETGRALAARLLSGLDPPS
jgi:hypothetical protein